MFKSAGFMLVLGIALGLLERQTGYLKLQVAKHFRAPVPGSIFSWYTKSVMSKNKEAAQKLVDIAQPGKDSAVLEIGPGFGFGLEHLLEKYEPSLVYGVELSVDFLRELQNKFVEPINSGKLVLKNQDAKDLSFLEDNSIDAMYALNVLYFLDPLSHYLKEFVRVLKPGGKIIFGVYEASQNQDPSIFVNLDWNTCVEAMKQAGLEDAAMGEPGIIKSSLTTGTILQGTKPLPPVKEEKVEIVAEAEEDIPIENAVPVVDEDVATGEATGATAEEEPESTFEESVSTDSEKEATPPVAEKEREAEAAVDNADPSQEDTAGAAEDDEATKAEQ